MEDAEPQQKRRSRWWIAPLVGVGAFALLTGPKIAAISRGSSSALWPLAWRMGIEEALFYLGLALPGIVLVLTNKRRLFALPLLAALVPLLFASWPWASLPDVNPPLSVPHLYLPVPEAFFHQIYLDRYAYCAQCRFPLPIWVRHPILGLLWTGLLVLAPAMALAILRRKEALPPLRFRWAAIPALALCLLAVHYLLAPSYLWLNSSYAFWRGWNVTDNFVIAFTFAAILGTRWPWWPFVLAAEVVFQSWLVNWAVAAMITNTASGSVYADVLHEMRQALPVDLLVLLIASVWRFLAWPLEAGFRRMRKSSDPLSPEVLTAQPDSS